MDGLDAAAPELSDQVADVTPDAPVVDEAPQPEAQVQEDLFHPEPELPEGDEVTAEWLKQRHKEMQADYTRKRQADSETAKARAEELEFLESLRSDPDTQRAVLEQLQELLAESENENGPPAEAPLEQQVRELREAQQARESQELAGHVVSHIEQLQKDAGIELDENDLRQVFASATQNGVGKQQTEKAFQAHVARVKAIEERAIKRYVESKRAPQQVPAGTPATETPDLSTREARIARMAAILEGGKG